MITFKVLLLLFTIVSIVLNLREFFKNGFKSKEERLTACESAIKESDDAKVSRVGLTLTMVIIVGLSLTFQLIYILMACSFITNIVFVVFSTSLFLLKTARMYRRIVNMYDTKKLAMLLPGKFGNIISHVINVIYPVVIFIALIVGW